MKIPFKEMDSKRNSRSMTVDTSTPEPTSHSFETSSTPDINKVSSTQLQFTLQELAKTRGSDYYGETLAYLTLPDRNKFEIEKLKCSPLITENFLRHIKHLEWTHKIAQSKKQRILILIKLVNNYFAVVLQNQPTTQSEVDRLSQYILNSVFAACKNEGLADPLDHEKYYSKNNSVLTEEDKDRIETSKKLEECRARVIASSLALNNLPDYFKSNLEKLGLKDQYLEVFKELCLSIIETGKQLRVNKRELDAFETMVRSTVFYDKEYVSLESIISKILPDSLIPQQSPTLTRKLSSNNMHQESFSLVRKLSSNNFHKPQPTNQPTLTFKVALKNKLKEAIIEWASNVQSKNKSMSSQLNHPTSQDNFYFIKSEFALSLEELIRKELGGLDKETIKQLTKNIEALKVKHLAALVEDWVSRSTIALSPKV